MLEEDIEILGDGAKLLDYAERNLRCRNLKLWRSFRRTCLSWSLTRIEALFDALGRLPDYVECKEYAEEAGGTYTLTDHLERCISTWIYYRKVRSKNPEMGWWKYEKQAFIFHTNGGRIRAIYVKKRYPLCSKIRDEPCVDLYGHLLCTWCDQNDCWQKEQKTNRV